MPNNSNNNNNKNNTNNKKGVLAIAPSQLFPIINMISKVITGLIIAVLSALFIWLTASIYHGNTQLALINQNLEQIQQSISRHVTMMERQDDKISNLEDRIHVLQMSMIRLEGRIERNESWDINNP